MEWRNQDKAIGSSAKRGLSSEEEEDLKKKKENNVIHEGTIFNPSPDGNPVSLDPVRPNPDPVRTQPDPVTRYRECQKNHAAHLGTHVLDGCGEFMPDADDGTLESLTCAACGCHRNFHRKEPGDGSSGPPGALIVSPSSNFRISFTARPPQASVLTPFPFRQAPATDRGRGFADQAAMMSFGEGGDASSEDLTLFGVGSSRKRFRTKFTPEQKEEMTAMAEKIGWRIQKEDEDEVNRFCDKSGVKRQVFKVWMHNNKQAMKRKES